jgi:hypothetical protein
MTDFVGTSSTIHLRECHAHLFNMGKAVLIFDCVDYS